MSATHTPGPWFVHDFSDIGGAVTVSCDHPATITVAAMENALTATLAEQQANAALIAAAPELLAALRGFVEWGREHTSPRDPNSPHALLIDAVAAIAKAEGRTP